MQLAQIDLPAAILEEQLLEFVGGASNFLKHAYGGAKAAFGDVANGLKTPLNFPKDSIGGKAISGMANSYHQGEQIYKIQKAIASVRNLQKSLMAMGANNRDVHGYLDKIAAALERGAKFSKANNSERFQKGFWNKSRNHKPTK